MKVDNCTARTLACYKSWADKLTLQAASTLPLIELTRERPTLFKTIFGTLNHSYVVDLIWRAHLEGRPHGFKARNVLLFTNLEALSRAQHEANEWLVAWSAAQSDACLNETVHFLYVSGKPGTLTRGEILMHMVVHATYHRGWIADLFYQIPAEPPTTDLCVFIGDRLAEPAR